MELHGHNIIGQETSSAGHRTYPGVNATSGAKLAPGFHEADESEIERALNAANSAFFELRLLDSERTAEFLIRIGDEILALGDDLIKRANAETALPGARLTGERSRTVGQLRMFAELVRSGDWLEATIDRAMPDRKPQPRPDLRRMLVPIGPVVVFGAGNFPLAFSVAGGDTASAIAAGNPVIIKAHPAHPGTSEMVGRAIQRAAWSCAMPGGIFSLLHGVSHDVGIQLVRHQLTRAVGFTGSWRAGKALFDAASTRPEPIPVFAEMGSTNPNFILPGALKEGSDALADGLMQSVALGVGQFCTNPGLVFGLGDSTLEAFIARLGQLAGNMPPGIMLHDGICERYKSAVEEICKLPGVRMVQPKAETGQNRAPVVVFATDGGTFLKQPALRSENFGPSTTVVRCGTTGELEAIASGLDGQLTATIHGTEDELVQNRRLISILRGKAGRLIFNQFPTGVEVCAAMQHGGPYPATTDSRFTSVGAAAIKRFARPVCYQNFPDAALPVELRNKNVRKIRRLIDNQFTMQDV